MRESRARVVIVLSIIRDYIDPLLHPSARCDALTAARHRAFMVPRLLGSLAAFAAFPVYLVMRGAPNVLEVIAFTWLIAPILLSYFLSRTGRYESAHMLSSLALAGLVMTVSLSTGGIVSFAVIWLAVLPFEAALSASRRLVTFASLLALACIGTLTAVTSFGWLPSMQMSPPAQNISVAFGVVSATIYAACLAFGVVSLAHTSVALRNREENRYRLLARNMSDVISRHNQNGAVQFISPAIETLLGAPADHLLGHGLFDRVHVADRPAYLTALSNATRGSDECSVEFRLRREGARGERGRPASVAFIWIEMRCRSLDATSREGEVVAVMRDVTDRKTQEHALETARAETQRADAAKSRFLATMSHELRTPLNAIIGFSEMIVKEDDLRLDAIKRKEYAQLINDSGQHLLSVVNGILDISKMETGNFEILPEPFAPRPALVNCCNLLALKARENGIDLVTRTPDELPDITGDLRAFKQIVINLVSNAIKFTERGGTVTVSAEIDVKRLVLRVTDNGVGIGAEDLKRIGDPFFQAGKTYQRRYEGTGLGLSIVKSLVGLHGGEMTVHSQLDEGTTVTIALPVEFTPRERASNIETLIPASRAAASNQVKKSA